MRLEPMPMKPRFMLRLRSFFAISAVTLLDGYTFFILVVTALGTAGSAASGGKKYLRRVRVGFG